MATYTAKQALEIALMPSAAYDAKHQAAAEVEAEAYSDYSSSVGTRGGDPAHSIGHGSWVSGFHGQGKWHRRKAAREELERARGTLADGLGWRVNRVADDGSVQYSYRNDLLPYIETHGLVAADEVPGNPADLIALVRSRFAHQESR